MSVGVAGLGLMGGPIAAHLAVSGEVRVWNRSLKRGTPSGTERVADAAELGARCDVVHLSLLDGAAVEAVVFGPAGVLDGAPPGGTILDHSTISAAQTCALASRAAERGWDWVDAPVSGGSAGAVAGTLTVFLGCDEAAEAQAQAAVAPFAARATRMGPVGAGQATKAANQLIVGGTFVLLAEAAALAEASGVDAAALPEAMAGGFADSVLLQRQLPRMVAGAEELHGTGAVILKDMDLIADGAGGALGPRGAFAAARALWARHVAAGGGGRDWTAVIDTVRAEAEGDDR